MTQEEYERKIKEATAATNEAQAEKNAAEASALSSAVAGAMRVRANEGSAGLSFTPTQTEEERAAQQQAVEASVQAEQQAQKEADKSAEQVQKESEPEEEKPDEKPGEQAPVENAQAQEEAQRQADIATEQRLAAIAQSQQQAEVSQAVQQEEAANTPQAKMKSAVATAEKQKAEESEAAMVKTSTESTGNPEVKDEPNTDAKYMSEMHKANEQQSQMFTDIINERYSRMKDEEEEMRRQEQADMWSTMGTGATEVAAGIINMLGVGELNATHQQYHSFSQDWMKKADERSKENRKRRQDMRDTLERLKMQQKQVELASRIEEMKLAMQLAKDKEARDRQARAEALQREQIEQRRKEHADEMAYKEKALQQSAEESKANRGLQYSKLKAERDAKDATMLTYGYVRDDKAPGGYRYDEKAAARTRSSSRSSSSSSSSGSKSKNEFHFNDNGKSIPYYMSSDERKAFLEKAYAKVKDKPGFREEYESETRDADRNGVIMKYAEQDEELMKELYLYSTPEYQQAQQISQSVDNIFFGSGSSVQPAGYGVLAPQQ